MTGQNFRTGPALVRRAISSNRCRVSASSGLIFGVTISTRQNWSPRVPSAFLTPRPRKRNRAPLEVLNAYRPVPSRMKNVEVHIFPGIQHGFMMPGSPKAFDQKTRDFSMKRAFAILDGLRDGGAAMRKAS